MFMLSVCVCVPLLNHQVHVPRYENYPIKGHSSVIFLNFLASIVRTWRTQELVQLKLFIIYFWDTDIMSGEICNFCYKILL